MRGTVRGMVSQWHNLESSSWLQGKVLLEPWKQTLRAWVGEQGGKREGRERKENKSAGAGFSECWEMMFIYNQDLNWNHSQVKAHRITWLCCCFSLKLCLLAMSIVWFNLERSLSIPCWGFSFPKKETGTFKLTELTSSASGKNRWGLG